MGGNSSRFGLVNIKTGTAHINSAVPVFFFYRANNATKLLSVLHAMHDMVIFFDIAYLFQIIVYSCVDVAVNILYRSFEIMLRLDVKVIDMSFLYENAAVGYNCCIYIFYAESL